MRVIVQRVSKASVEVDGRITGAIGQGILVLLGVSHADGEAEADYLLDRVTGLRMFNDAGGKMNLSLRDVGGSLLVGATDGYRLVTRTGEDAFSTRTYP